MNLIQNILSPFQSSLFVNTIFAIVIGLVCGVGAILSPLITIAIIVGVVFFANGRSISNPLIACYWLVVFITFGSAMERGKLIPILAPNELVLLLVCIVSFLYIVSKQINRPISTTILFGMFVLIVGTAIIPIMSYRLRGISLSFQIMFKLIAPIQYIFIFWIFATIPRNHDDRTRIMQVMFLCASVVSIIALLQALRIPFVLDFLRTWYPGGHTEVATGAVRGRVTSVLAAWNTLGTFMMVNILCLTAIQNMPFSKRYRINMAISAVLSLLTLVASGSYASLGGTIIGFILLKIIDPRGLKDLMPFFIAGGIGIFLLLPNIVTRLDYQFETSDDGVPNTLAFRFKIWRDIYIPLIAKNPIWGSVPSFENLSFAHAESQYIALLVQSGVVALSAFLIWLLSTFIWLLNIIRGEKTTMRMVALATFMSFALLTAMGLTNPVFTYSGVMDFLWIYLGLIASSQRNKLHVVY